MRSIFLLSLTLVLAAACSDDTPLTDGGVDGQPLEDGGVPITLGKGGDGHKDVSARLSSGQVRAGRVTSKSQLLSGIKVEGKVGDFKIYNDRVAFIIQDAHVSNGWAPFGGEVVDASLLNQTGSKGDSLLGELILATGVKLVKPTSVGVIRDGSDGKSALVRVIGEPALIPYLGGLLGGANFGGKLDVIMVMEYELAPDSEALTIRWRLFNSTYYKQTLPMMIQGVAAGDGADPFSEGDGFDPQNVSKLSYIGMVGEHIAYALVSLETQMLQLVKYSGVWVLATNMLELEPAGEVQQTYRLVVTKGEPEALRAVMRKLQKKSEPATVSGTVKDGAGKPVAGARVHVEKSGTSVAHYVTFTRTDASGRFSLALEPGSYKLVAVADGRWPSSGSTVTVGSSASTQDLTLGGTGKINFSVTDSQGSPIPAKLVFTPKGGVKSVPASYGETSYPHGAALVVFTTTGSGSAALPPDTYTLHVSRGYEYEISTATVTVTDGGTQTTSHKLSRSVDTTGYMCGDFHLHSMWSQDSNDLYQFKIATLAAAGVELPVATDHEYIADYNPYINKLNLQKWIYGIVGEELTTLTYGHFNPFPVTQDPTKANMGAMTWFQKSPAKLFAEVRARWPGAVFQVNHPRSPPIGGYFSYVGWDPAKGTFTNEDGWSKNFDAFEVFNSSAWSLTKAEVLDWFSFLDRGFLVTATGNSDSHHAMKSQVGWPRNYVKLSTDEPAKVSLSEFARNIKDQRLLVSGGAFVTVDIGGKSMGEVADASSRKVTLKIKVQAPTWITVSTLEIIMGGALVKKVTLDSSTADPKNPVVRYNGSVELLPARDSYVVVAVGGGGSLAPVSGGTAFAVTNPIYLDVDGNGVYDAPKSF